MSERHHWFFSINKVPDHVLLMHLTESYDTSDSGKFG